MPTRNPFRFTTLGQLVERIGPNRLEQSPAARRRRCPANERLGHQACDAFGNHGGRRTGIAHHRRRRLERETTRENGQATQQGPLRLRQQLVAPVQRRTQGLVPRQRHAAAGRQQAEAIIQEVGRLRKSQRRGARRREFDGKRDAVELPADRGDQRQVFRARREAGVERGQPGVEQLNGAVFVETDSALS